MGFPFTCTRQENRRINEEQQGGKVQQNRNSNTPIRHWRLTHHKNNTHMETSLYKMSGIPHNQSEPMATKRLPLIQSPPTLTEQFCTFSPFEPPKP